MVATLHTWGSNLSYHPHVHCIVPAGAFENGVWENKQGNNTPNFFCNATQLRQLYKRLFIQHFLELIEYAQEPKPAFTWAGEKIEEKEELFAKLQSDFKKACSKKWTVRIENPVLGTEQIIAYLARYVRRVAITNSRIVAVTDSQVSINYKQYHLQKKGKPAPIGVMDFDGVKFIQRFAQHIPPSGFHKVRYYGCYAFGKKALRNSIYTSLTQQPAPIYQKPSTQQLVITLLGHDPDVCTNCGSVGCFVTSPIAKDATKGYHLTRSYTVPPSRAGPSTTAAKIV